jgi:hypothetical protein
VAWRTHWECQCTPKGIHSFVRFRDLYLNVLVLNNISYTVSRLKVLKDVPSDSRLQQSITRRSGAESVQSWPLPLPGAILFACINFISGGTRQAPILWSSGGYKQQIGSMGGAMQIWWKSGHSRKQLQQRYLHGMRRIRDKERQVAHFSQFMYRVHQQHPNCECFLSSPVFEAIN